MRFKKDFENVISCNLCSSKDHKPFLQNITTWEHPGRFNLVKCQNCDLVFLNPRPRPNQIAQYYLPERYWGGEDISKPSWESITEKWRKERDKRYGRLYQEILRRFPKPARILDIGCGTGGFLTAFKEREWQVLGTEVSPWAAFFSKKTYGFPVRIGDFLKVNLSGKKFEVAVFNNVLEHLFWPRETLMKISKILVGNGLLVVTVPNIKSLGFKLFEKEWYPIQPPRHLYHFSPKTIRALFKKTSFKVLAITHSNWDDNFYSLFESFRFKFSPRFKKTTSGGLLKSGGKLDSTFLSLFKKEIGKIFDFVFAWTLALTGAVLKKGEVFTVYAQKA